MQIVISCLRDGGMIRGGIRHPHAAVAYESTAFSADQLREMVEEPELVVVAGHLLTEGEIDAAVVHPAPLPAATKPPKKGR
jgi:hypothetical protein